MTGRDVLIQAREELKDPKHWIKGESRRELPCGDFAYCLTGIIVHIAPNDGIARSEAYSLINGVLQRWSEQDRYPIPRESLDPRGSFTTVTFNDRKATTHSDVMDLLDEAIGE